MKRAAGGVVAVMFVVTLAAPSCDVAPPCQTSNDCPAPPACMFNTCIEGRCSEEASLEGARCAGGVCTEAGKCIECIKDTDCTTDPCQPSTCQQGKCMRTPLPDGTSCPGTGDVNCTKGGTCQHGQCAPVPLPDGTSCPMIDQADACSEARCQSGTCKVGPKPEGAGCNTQVKSCGIVDTCQAGACVAAPAPTTCEQGSGHESNDTQAAAFPLGTLSDCDQFSLCDATTAGDVDWYVYQGKDDICAVNAAVTFSAPLEVCEYWTCTDPQDSSSATNCPTGTHPDVAPGGQPGCCGSSSWGLNPCPGNFISGNSSATVWIKVTGPANTCTPYTLTYEF